MACLCDHSQDFRGQTPGRWDRPSLLSLGGLYGSGASCLSLSSDSRLLKTQANVFVTCTPAQGLVPIKCLHFP